MQRAWDEGTLEERGADGSTNIDRRTEKDGHAKWADMDEDS